MKEVLKTDTTTFNIDSTAIDYNFIGNDRKPLYVCTWLASKSVPIGTSSGTGNSVGGGDIYSIKPEMDLILNQLINYLNNNRLKISYITMSNQLHLVGMMQKFYPITSTEM